jgi:predicted PurR-regulated permease PerM
LPFAFAFALAYLLAPAVDFLERRRLPPGAAVLAVYAALFAALFALAAALGPTLVREGHRLLANYPAYERAGREGLGSAWRTYRSLPLPPAVRAESDRLLAEVGGGIRWAARASVRGLAATVPVAAAAAVSPVLAYYVLRDRHRLAAAFWRRVPVGRRAAVARLLRELDVAVGGFVRGQLLVAGAVGGMALGLALAFRLPYPVFIAAVAAVTDIIPYVGPLLGAVPAVAFALVRSPVLAAWVLAAFLAVHEVEGAVLSPYLLGGQVGMHPLLVVGAVLVAGDLFGFAGALLAVPGLASARIVARYLLAEAARWAREGERRPSVRAKAGSRRRAGAFQGGGGRLR